MRTKTVKEDQCLCPKLGRIASKQTARAIFAIIALTLAAAAAAQSVTSTPAPFVIEDYFTLKRVVELALSPDGKRIAYIVEDRVNAAHSAVSGPANVETSQRVVYLGPALPGAEQETPKPLRGARALRFLSDGRIAFIAADYGDLAQVRTYDPETKEVRTHTESGGSVASFAFAPDGKTLAYVVSEPRNQATLHEQIYTGERGLIIDSDTFRIQYFTDPSLGAAATRRTLYVQRSEGESNVIAVPGTPTKFAWGPQGRRLAVAYADDAPTTSLFGAHRQSLGLYEADSGRFRTLAQAKMATLETPGVSYGFELWIPETEKLIVRRAAITDIFVSPRHPEWAVVDLREEVDLGRDDQIWREMSRAGRDRRPVFHAAADGRILLNLTINGDYRRLYVPAGAGLAPAAIAADSLGNITMARLDARMKTAVFVNDSLTEPPEIRLWRDGKKTVALTELNGGIVAKRRPEAHEVLWRAKDGTQLRGWLLLPPGAAESAKIPLLTFVHGGPSTPMPIDFAGHFPAWPYPFDLYAMNGIGVFFANYRGNTTFGRDFASPDTLDGQPVSDIIIGIEQLLKMRRFDEQRLGISGFSWGAWLGPMVMTRYREFRAASFAEGAGNYVTVYDLASRNVNRGVHDDIVGASLYDDPTRYLRLSPALHFRGLRTASLFEAGSRSAAILMMGYPKAARYADMPTEFVIYPQTGHNPSRPDVQKESAIRNLDWFRFWLQDYEDPDPKKSEQYQRWREMRQERCSLSEATTPNYCDFQ